MNVFGEVCWRQKLKVNITKSKIMVVSKTGVQQVDVHLNGEKIKQVRCIRYLGKDIYKNGRMNEELVIRQGKCRCHECFNSCGEEQVDLSGNNEKNA